MKDASEITRNVLQRRDAWQQERNVQRRILTRTTVMLLVVLTLCGGAVAASRNTLADFFMGYRGGTLSPEQEAVATLAEDFKTRTVVSGDWTVTADNAICDGLNYYLTMSITGPEGWREGTSAIEWAAVELFAGGQVRKWNAKTLWHEYELADADTDYYVMCLTLEEPIEGSLTVELRDMILIRGESEDWLKEEKTWVFEDLEFAATGEPVELLAEPVVIRTGIALDVGTCVVQLDSVQLRTFALHIAYSAKDRVGSPDLKGQLVLKDGTAYELHFSDSGDRVSGNLKAMFGFPVLPEEADYILLEDIKLDIP